MISSLPWSVDSFLPQSLFPISAPSLILWHTPYPFSYSLSQLYRLFFSASSSFLAIISALTHPPFPFFLPSAINRIQDYCCFIFLYLSLKCRYVRLRSTSNLQIHVQFRCHRHLYLRSMTVFHFLKLTSKMTYKRVRVMVFNATFNNISVILWRLVLLVEETGVPGENHWPAVSHWQTLLLNVVSDNVQTWPTSIIWQDKSTYSSSLWKGRRFDSNKSAIDLRIGKDADLRIPLNRTVNWDNGISGCRSEICIVVIFLCFATFIYVKRFRVIF